MNVWSHRRATLALGVITMLASAPALAQTQSPPPDPAAGATRDAAKAPSDAELLAAVDGFAAEALKLPGTVGLSIAVGRGDKVILSKGYGLAEAEHGVPANAQTMFRIGSVTKQFTAAAVMRLVEQGKLSLDDPLHKHLPDYPEQAREVTIRHLLNHTSGIKSYTELPEIMQKYPSMARTDAELVATFKDIPVDFKPGEKWHYNNSGYYLLGMIIEKVSGKPYAQHVYDEFFAPLGLLRTRYDSNDELVKNRAQGYRMTEKGLANDIAFATSVPGAAGGLLSTAEDLVKWNQALVSGKVISEASYRQMTTPAVLTSGEPTDYGFGLVVDSFEGRRRVSHGGGIFGFLSMLMYLPDEGVTIAVIVNSEDAATGLSSKIAKAAIGLEVQGLKDVPLAEAELQRYVGEFQFTEIPMAIRFFVKEGRLMAQATGQPEIPLLYQGDHAFGASFDENLRLVFPAADAAKPGDPAGTVTLHQGGGTFTANRK